MRSLRLLVVGLAITGCAVESPPPVGIPSPARLPAPGSPVPPPVISRFGDWHSPGGGPRPWQHYGTDIRAAVGTPALAAADGTVLRVGQQALAGKLIIVRHADDLATVYFHLSEIGVVAGQTVRRGEVLGRTGITGNATTPHLHFGVCRREGGRCGSRIDDGWEDPAAYWVEGNPCFAAGRASSATRVRFTYPVPCPG